MSVIVIQGLSSRLLVTQGFGVSGLATPGCVSVVDAARFNATISDAARFDVAASDAARFDVTIDDEGC